MRMVLQGKSLPGGDFFYFLPGGSDVLSNGFNRKDSMETMMLWRMDSSAMVNFLPWAVSTMVPRKPFNEPSMISTWSPMFTSTSADASIHKPESRKRWINCNSSSRNSAGLSL